MNTLEAIQERRSIRRFKGDPVDRATIDKVLDAAVMAPSAKNSQPWRFTVVPESKRDEMIVVLRGAIARREANGEDTGSSKWSVEVMAQAPVTVFVHNADGVHPWLARKEHESWWDVATVQSVGAAIENMLLAATELGVGSLWIADVWEAYQAVNEWLGTDDQLVSAVSFGIADVSPAAPPRKPMDSVVRWVE